MTPSTSTPMPVSFIPPTPSPSSLLLLSLPLFSNLPPLLSLRLTTPHPPSNYHFPPHIISHLLSLPTPLLSFPPSTILSSNSPPPLSTFASQLSTLSTTAFPTLPQSPISMHTILTSSKTKPRCRKRPSPAKRLQIETLASALQHCIAQTSVPVTRIVDMGAGHAHLSAHLAARLSHANIPVIAIDKDPAFIATARSIHPPSIPNLTFQTAQVGTEHIVLGKGDFLIGLHACGSLADHILKLAASARVAGVFLVSCCLQKIHTQYRHPLSHLVNTCPELHQLLTLERHLLGVTNGGRGGNHADLKARETRYALRLLLEERSCPVANVGEEVHGISRHKVKRGLAEVADQVLQKRGLGTIDKPDLDRIEQRARKDYADIRKLSLPRLMAGQALEMAIVLDRAAFLEEAAFKNVTTCRIWPDHLSVRNLCCIAYR